MMVKKLKKKIEQFKLVMMTLFGMGLIIVFGFSAKQYWVAVENCIRLGNAWIPCLSTAEALFTMLISGGLITILAFAGYFKVKKSKYL